MKEDLIDQLNRMATMVNDRNYAFYRQRLSNWKLNGKPGPEPLPPRLHEAFWTESNDGKLILSTEVRETVRRAEKL